MKPGAIIQRNWHDNVDLIGLRVVECLGESYDPRGLKLYRLSNGWLGWLPGSCFGVNKNG